MADKYLIQIQPQISNSDGAKMEADLNKRFAKVSTKFGTHIKNALNTSFKAVAGLTAGLAAGLIAAVATNPFDKINEDLNATLDRFDDIAVRAEEFGVNSGKYFRNETIAKSLGVEDYAMILARYQAKLDEARSKAPGQQPENNYLQNFTQDKDVIDSFNAFAETLRHLNATERARAVEEVFGGKLGLRIAELLQTNLPQRNKQIFGNIKTSALTSQISGLSSAEDIQRLNQGRLSVKELEQKSGAISANMLNQQNAIEEAKLAKDVAQLNQYQLFAELKTAQEESAAHLNEIKTTLIQGFTPRFNKFLSDFDTVSTWAKKRFGFKNKGNVFNK